MEKILVTGGAGFIGSHVCEALLNKGYKVYCLDNFNNYYSPERKIANIGAAKRSKDFTLIKADISNLEEMKEAFSTKFDRVVHLAARAGVRPSVEDPWIYEQTNVRGLINLLELSVKGKVKNFVFGSSSSVYGRNAKVPFSEEDRTDMPVSPYAATKKAGEVICHTYNHLYGLKISCLRFFTVYGPRGRPDMAPYLFTERISKGEPITVYGDGKSKRDYTYVADIVEGITAAMVKDYGYEIFNLGNSEPQELSYLISTIEGLVGKKAKITRKEILKEDVQVTFADIAKAKRMLGYNPRTSLREGLAKFTEWYKAQ